MNYLLINISFFLSNFDPDGKFDAMEHENANLIFFDSDFSYITSFQKNYVNDRVLLVLVDAKWAKNLKKSAITRNYTC